MDMLTDPTDPPHPPDPPDPTLRRTAVGTLDRAVSVLDAVGDGVHRLGAIARATGLPHATAHRLVRALEQHGFLARYPGFGYRFGPRLLRLANEAMRELPLRDVAHPVLEQLARTTGETAQLYVRSGDARVCLDAVESANELRTIVGIGAALPLSAGSAAKVFLAFSSADPSPFIRRAADPERFARDVELARARGWASSTSERQAGVGSVSAPIRGAYDILLGVVSVSGPSSRMGRISARRYAPAVVDAAARIERALGR
jgi:DNA-binding IclR family transcriptional regulator